MDYVTPKDKAIEWGLTQRRAEIFCDKGCIPGTYRLDRVWAIPKDVGKPTDGRTKAAKQKLNTGVIINVSIVEQGRFEKSDHLDHPQLLYEQGGAADKGEPDI